MQTSGVVAGEILLDVMLVTLVQASCATNEDSSDAEFETVECWWMSKSNRISEPNRTYNHPDMLMHHLVCPKGINNTKIAPVYDTNNLAFHELIINHWSELQIYTDQNAIFWYK